MFSRQLFKAIQSASHWEMSGESWARSFVSSVKKKNVILSRRFTGCDTTDAGRSPSRCRGGQSYVFSCASVRGGACLWSHPKLSSSYISHRATCRHEKNTAFSHERAMKSSSFSYVWVSNAGTRRKVRAQAGSLRRRVREWVWLRRSGG